jgi:hypothetical protein
MSPGHCGACCSCWCALTYSAQLQD